MLELILEPLSNLPVPSPALQGSSLRSDPEAKGRFGLAPGGLSTPSQVIPRMFRSICAARKDGVFP